MQSQVARIRQKQCSLPSVLTDSKQRFSEFSISFAFYKKITKMCCAMLIFLPNKNSWCNSQKIIFLNCSLLILERLNQNGEAYGK